MSPFLSVGSEMLGRSLAWSPLYKFYRENDKIFDTRLDIFLFVYHHLRGHLLAFLYVLVQMGFLLLVRLRRKHSCIIQ